MRTSHFLFLGLRHARLEPPRDPAPHLGRSRREHFASWAIQLDPSEIDQRFWDRKRRVEILDVPLDDWVDAHARARSA